MGSGFSKMKKQARAFQEQMEKMRQDAQNTQIEGASEGNLVTVIINGEKEILSIKIKPECVDPSDLEGLQDLIKSACSAAYKKLAAQTPSAAPMGFPGF